MNIIKEFPLIFTYGLLPFFLFVLCIYALWKMLQAGIERPPIISIMISLVHYGGLLFLLSVKLLAEWNNFAIMLLAYLSAFAPILEIILGTVGIRRFNDTVFHRLNVRLAFGYPIMVSIIFLIIYLQS